LRIGIAFDLVPNAIAETSSGPDDRYEEFDKPETLAALGDVLRGAGHEVVLLGDGREFLQRVLDDPPDLVWNLAEGEGIGRCREARVPAALEMLGIPYTGSDPLTLAAALDKDVAKRLVAGAGAAVPGGIVLGARTTRAEASARLTDFAKAVAFPWLLKPACEGSSKGIRTRCLVDSEAEALDLFLTLARDYEQPILVEEFIAGDEVTVGLVGNGERLEIVGAMRVVPIHANGRFVYSLDLKREWSDHIRYEIPAQLAPEVSDRLRASARSAYEALGCRDVARIDFRIRSGVPYFLEANPLPGLAPDWSDLVILARGMGLGYSALIQRILHEAVVRTAVAAPRRQTREIAV
jgi:D-alanine-D-alanine ligase